MQGGMACTRQHPRLGPHASQHPPHTTRCSQQTPTPRALAPHALSLNGCRGGSQSCSNGLPVPGQQGLSRLPSAELRRCRSAFQHQGPPAGAAMLVRRGVRLRRPRQLHHKKSPKLLQRPLTGLPCAALPVPEHSPPASTVGASRRRRCCCCTRPASLGPRAVLQVALATAVLPPPCPWCTASIPCRHARVLGCLHALICIHHLVGTPMLHCCAVPAPPVCAQCG
jgi:hypothetical protein